MKHNQSKKCCQKCSHHHITLLDVQKHWQLTLKTTKHNRLNNVIVKDPICNGAKNIEGNISTVPTGPPRDESNDI